jgi:hypothetical protein
MVTEENKELLMNILKNKGRSYYTEIKEIVIPDETDTSKSIMSEQTMCKGLKELVQEGRLHNQRETYVNGEKSFYRIPEWTEWEKSVIELMKTELLKLEKLKDIIGNKEFKSKSKTKEQQILDEKGFAMHTLTIFYTYLTYLHATFTEMEQEEYSPILEEGQEMFDAVKSWIPYIKNINQITDNEFTSFMWEVNNPRFNEDIESIYGEISKSYNIQLGLRDV